MPPPRARCAGGGSWATEQSSAHGVWSLSVHLLLDRHEIGVWLHTCGHGCTQVGRVHMHVGCDCTRVVWLHTCGGWPHTCGRSPGCHRLLPAWSRLSHGLAAGLREETVGAPGRLGPAPRRSLGISSLT